MSCGWRDEPATTTAKGADVWARLRGQARDAVDDAVGETIVQVELRSAAEELERLATERSE